MSEERDFTEAIRRIMDRYNEALGEEEEFKNWETTIDNSMSKKGNVLTLKVRTKIKV